MNIFICQTPFQGFYAKRIIENICLSSKNQQQFVIYHSGFEDILDLEGVRLINLDIKQGFLSSYSKFRSAIRFIRNIRNTGKEVNFFIPHRGGLIANYIFHNQAFNDNDKVFINFYYEGILYLYDYKEPLKSFHHKRFVLGILCGFKYKRNELILPYNSDRINKIYTPIKKYTKGPIEKLIKVEFKRQEGIKDKSNVHLILGGPVSFIKELYNEAIDEIFAEHEFVNSSSQEIYYKGHGSFKTHNSDFENIFANISKSRKIKYKELNLLTPMEDLIHEISPCCIYSYYSSALLNIRLMGYDDIKIICYISEKEVIQPVILQAFKEYNIIIKNFKNEN